MHAENVRAACGSIAQTNASGSSTRSSAARSGRSRFARRLRARRTGRRSQNRAMCALPGHAAGDLHVAQRDGALGARPLRAPAQHLADEVEVLLELVALRARRVEAFVELVEEHLLEDAVARAALAVA